MVPTMSRSSGLVEMSRAIRSTRARRATPAKAPAAGSSNTATTTKSKTFQPSEKNLWTRGQQARRRIAISTTNTA